jgi:hypothetical protein
MIYRNANLPLQSKVGTATCTAGSPLVALPADFLSFDYLYVVDVSGNAGMLLNKEADFIFQAFPLSTYQALPQYYSVLDNVNLRLGPTPDSAYVLNYQYVFAPPSIVTAGISWIGTNAQNALLYASLIQAYTYMKGEDSLVQMYQGLYQDALGVLKKLGEGDERKDEYRTPSPRPISQEGAI